MAVTKAALSWLEEPGSLTARLRTAVGAGFGVRLLGQGYGRPFDGEADLLGLPSRRRALFREVLLHCQGRPLVLARSVIPPRTLRSPHCGLAHLGNRPLGELLFAYPGLRRSQLELAKVTQAIWCPSIAEWFGVEGSIWGRRSRYEVGQASLSVCEFFLPPVLDLVER